MAHGSLHGLRVLDFSRLIPGPYATALLAGLGAEVLKVEDPRGGDPLRHFPPFVDGVGAAFLALNRGKQSVSLDLKTDRGRQIAQDLAACSDVVVEGFRPGVAERLGIDFVTLAALNPRLVYCSISGYGQEGEYVALPGHDLAYAALAGLLDALSPGLPQVPGVQLADAASSLVAAFRICAALHAVDAGPQYIDVTLLAASQTLMPVAISEAHPALTGGPLLSRVLAGSERNNIYECSDGLWLALTPIEEHFWDALLRVLRQEGRIEPEEQPSVERLAGIFRQRPADEWFAILSAGGVPCGLTRTVAEALPDAVIPGTPDGSLPAPGLGEHTAIWLETLSHEARATGGGPARRR
jgi:crotonobetainyl-CoA:carnitine CoA-transferase CaiB-like acyl-CoA transferase